jgi:hypothetical protein
MGDGDAATPSCFLHREVEDDAQSSTRRVAELVLGFGLESCGQVIFFSDSFPFSFSGF